MVAVVFAALVMLVYGVQTMIVVAICLLLLAAVCAGFAWDYLSRRRFYQELEKSIKGSNETYYVTEFVERPSFSEGRLVYDTLEQATKDMNDRIAEQRFVASEYQEYVETWIHEVKTPLAASRLIIENRDDSELQSLEHELDRIEAYVEQALYFARSTALENDYALKAVSLDSLIKEAVKKQSRILIEQDITPRFKGLETSVYCDPKWLDFIIRQIIANAAKYARPHAEGHAPTIVFSAERTDEGLDESKVILSITDNGIGVPAHDVKRVFEKGFTGENGRLHAKSTGIGLYLCKKLCTHMKLKISLDSIKGEGTTVHIEFPLNKMHFLEQEREQSYKNVRKE